MVARDCHQSTVDRTTRSSWRRCSRATAPSPRTTTRTPRARRPPPAVAAAAATARCWRTTRSTTPTPRCGAREPESVILQQRGCRQAAWWGAPPGCLYCRRRAVLSVACHDRCRPSRRQVHFACDVVASKMAGVLAAGLESRFKLTSKISTGAAAGDHDQQGTLGEGQAHKRHPWRPEVKWSPSHSRWAMYLGVVSLRFALRTHALALPRRDQAT